MYDKRAVRRPGAARRCRLLPLRGAAVDSMDPQRRRVQRYEAFVCSNPSCKGYRWADIARLRGETHCTWCACKFKAQPELRPYYQVDGTKGKGKGKGVTEASPPAKGGKKGKKPKGGDPTGYSPPGGRAASGKHTVTQTFIRERVDTDEVHKARTEYNFMASLHGKDSQKASVAYEELQEKLEARNAERTPSQRATEKRRILKNLRNKLAKDAAALDQAEEALKRAQNLYYEAETRLEESAVRVDKCEEELQYLEEEFLRPPAAKGPQRDLDRERAQEAIDEAVPRGSQGEHASAIQQATNYLMELLDQASGTAEGQPVKKKSKIEGDADTELPPVPEDHAEPELRQPEAADADMESDSDLDSDGPNTKASVKILRQYSSKTTRVHVHRQGALAKVTGQGHGKGDTKGHTPQGGKGPTPGEAHGVRKPGLQPAAGGEAGNGTATPQAAAPTSPAEGDTARNRWGDGPP